MMDMLALWRRGRSLGPGLETQVLRREGSSLAGCGLPAAGRVAPGRGAAVALVQPRGLSAPRRQPSPGPQGEQELLSFVSVEISIVGEELSGATPLRSGRRDGSCCLLVSYRP